jgi:GNAT superfamily N-acetyltransferase
MRGRPFGRVTLSASLSIRNASCADAAAIAAVQVDASRAAYGSFAPPGYFEGFTVSRRTTAWRTIIADQADRERLIVGEESEHSAGYAHFGCSRDAGATSSVGELYSLYVAPAHWQRGFGTQLLQASVCGLAHMHFDTATLWVLAQNRRAREFYERFGWTPDGAEKQAHPAMTEIRYRSPPLAANLGADQNQGQESL